MNSVIAGCIIAGGRARRLGGAGKSHFEIGGRSIIDHVVSRIAPQVGALAVNANGDPARFAALRLPVLADALPGQLGPLAGLLAGLQWSPAPLLLTVPGDTPFLPTDLAARLLAASAGKSCAIAQSGGRRHPVCGLWRKDIAGELRHYLAQGRRTVEGFTDLLDCGVAVWPAEPYDPFFNINTPEDLLLAQKIAVEVRM
jgi:molybdopterin-guanine dinucleotide biosynthesis protein A